MRWKSLDYAVYRRIALCSPIELATFTVVRKLHEK